MILTSIKEGKTDDAEGRPHMLSHSGTLLVRQYA
jgi:hypothetical protein